jgi:hypothetical protein
MPLTGRHLVVRRSLTAEDHGDREVLGPLLVLGYEPPWYLVTLGAGETGWVGDDGVRLVTPRAKA